MPASSAVVNTTLTNFGQGYENDKAESLADFIAPQVATGVASGQYVRYSDKNAFQVYETNRAIGGSRTRIEFSKDDPFFNCQPQGLEIALDDHERNMAPAGILNVQQAKIRTLVNNAKTSHEHKVFAAIKAGATAVSGVGVWSNAANSPIEDIDAQIEAIATETGQMPNRIAIGLGMWRVLKNHAKVLSRQAGVTDKALTYSGLASMLLNPDIEIRVGIMSRDTAKFGKAKTAENIIGGEMYIFVGNDTPDQYDPSFAKTFGVETTMLTAVKEYRDDNAVSDVYPIDWDEDIKVTAPASGRRITLS